MTQKESHLETAEIKYPTTPPSAPSETELLQAEVVTLKERIAKIEAVPLVKTALEPIAIDPIIIK